MMPSAPQYGSTPIRPLGARVVIDAARAQSITGLAAFGVFVAALVAEIIAPSVVPVLVAMGAIGIVVCEAYRSTDSDKSLSALVTTVKLAPLAVTCVASSVYALQTNMFADAMDPFRLIIAVGVGATAIVLYAVLAACSQGILALVQHVEFVPVETRARRTCAYVALALCATLATAGFAWSLRDPSPSRYKANLLLVGETSAYEAKEIRVGETVLEVHGPQPRILPNGKYATSCKLWFAANESKRAFPFGELVELSASKVCSDATMYVSSTDGVIYFVEVGRSNWSKSRLAVRVSDGVELSTSTIGGKGRHPSPYSSWIGVALVGIVVTALGMRRARRGPSSIDPLDTPYRGELGAGVAMGANIEANSTKLSSVSQLILLGFSCLPMGVFLAATVASLVGN